MEETSHLVTHFMAAGAEQRLGDYLFLKHTYETISDQETQLNRILRMLGEDEIVLNWHIDTTPIDRARFRSLNDFDRFGDSKYLPGRIAYERLREMEKEDFKNQPASLSSRRSYGTRRKSNEKNDQSSLSNGTSSTPSAARLRALAEYEAELAEAEAQRRERRAAEKSQEIELISFGIRYEDSSTSGDDENTLGRLLCEWISPSSSSDIDYFLIERQLGDQQWLPIGKKIEKFKNQIQLDISSLLFEEENQPLSSCFRLKARLENGKLLTSQPSEEINLSSLVGKRLIVPNVEILSPNSVQLTWANDGNENIYDIEKKEADATEWTKVSKVLLAQGSAQVENLTAARQCQFRLVPSKIEKSIKSEEEIEPEMLTVHNVNEWLGSLRLVPTSASTVDVDISEEGFKEFDRYKVEYTTIDQLDQWQQIPDITRDVPHLTVDSLKSGSDYKFRFTPVLRGATTSNETTSSQLSLVLDVKMPSTRKGRLVKNEAKLPSPPPQFAIHQTDPTSVLIEAIIPSDKPASFDDLFDVYSKKETGDDQWTKVGTIDKDHLSIVMKNLSENTSYAFKIVNQSSSDDEQNNVIQQFNFDIASVKLYDPSVFLAKIEQSLESVVNGVMRAAAGHQVLEDPLNISLNEVIQAIFHDETLVPNEQYGFDTLALSNDLQLFRGPKQMMLQELRIHETSESSKRDGEIIIHNYCNVNREQQPVIVREENGNTRIGNIDGDVIVRNVVTDVLLMNEETRNQLSMNIVGQAFLKGVQGILIASKFKGIIVVKNVMKI